MCDPFPATARPRRGPRAPRPDSKAWLFVGLLVQQLGPTARRLARMPADDRIDPSSLTEQRSWQRAHLETVGFAGWVTFQQLACEPASVSSGGGVYVVHRGLGKPRFSAESQGGRFKGRDPSVSEDVLRANWVDGAGIVYIGKADNLRRRLREFTRFGEGEPIGHWGGRLIWQLADSADLLVAWKETPGRAPREVEADMIAGFRKAWGKPPFANEPHRLGR